MGSGGQQDGCSHGLVDAVDDVDGFDVGVGTAPRPVEPRAMTGRFMVCDVACVFVAL